MNFQLYLGLLLTAGVASFGYKLELVQSLYRHGDRAPAVIYPNDPHGLSPWPKGLGELTTIGMQQQYNRGQYLRKRYSALLNDTYLPWQLYVNSSAVDRCLMSAEARLAGLYPPQGADVFTPGIDWQPLPVHSIPVAIDRELEEPECPKYDDLLEKLYQSPQVQEEENKNKAFYAMVANYSGYDALNISNVWRVADTLLCERVHNLSLPEWVTEQVYSKLRALDSYQFQLMTNSTPLARLRAGPLLKQMIQNIEKKQRGEIRTNYFMYSAHDTTVSGLLSALRVFNAIAPPYASTVLLELYSGPGEEESRWSESVVRVLYLNDSQHDPYPLQLPGCSDIMCPWSDFMTSVQAAVPQDWEQECQEADSQLEQFPTLQVLLGSLMLLALIASTLYVWLQKHSDCCPCRSEHHHSYTKLSQDIRE